MWISCLRTKVREGRTCVSYHARVREDGDVSVRVGQRGQAASAANRSPGIYIMVPVQLITAWAGAGHPVELQTKVRNKHNHREGLY